jgi:uncharacterized membrane protein YvlD (DUF360 family)
MIKLTSIRPSRIIIAIFSSFLILALLEVVVSNVYFSFTHMTYQQAVTQQASWAAVGVLQSILLNVIALIAARFIKSFEGAWKA